jgi:CDP-diacylglycerol--glycerol-3-phosphate 3-phosphatidyltransferase
VYKRQRLFLAPLFLYLFLSENPFNRKLALVIFLVAVTTDWYDGWHARKYGLVSKTGIFLDPLADKILTSAAFLGFYFLGLMPLWMVIIIVVRDIAITLLRSYQELKGKTLKTTFLAKTKTFIQMAYLFLIVVLVCSISFEMSESAKSDIRAFLNSDVNYFLMLVVTLITLYTGVTYFFESNKLTVNTSDIN